MRISWAIFSCLFCFSFLHRPFTALFFDRQTDPSLCSVYFHGVWAADGSPVETAVAAPLTTKPLAVCDSPGYLVFREVGSGEDG